MILRAHVPGVCKIVGALLRAGRVGVGERPGLSGLRRGLCDGLQRDRPNGDIFVIDGLDLAHNGKAAGRRLRHGYGGGPLIGGLSLRNGGIRREDHAVRGLPVRRVLEASPRLPEENNVPGVDGRVEYVPGIEERLSVHVCDVPTPRGLWIALQHLRPLNIGGGRGLDRFRDGEAAELLKLPGVLGCHYKGFHGIAISFRYVSEDMGDNVNRPPVPYCFTRLRV